MTKFLDADIIPEPYLRQEVRPEVEGYYKQAFDPEIGFTKITGADGKKRIDEGLVNRRKQEEELAKNLWNPPE